MKKDYRKNISSFQYKLILGILVVSLLLGLFFLIRTFDIGSFVTWAYVIWVVFFGAATYCWLDEKRYAKFEYFMTPVLFGLLFLLQVLLCLAGMYIAISSFISKEYSLFEMIVGLFGSACCGAFAYFSFIFFLRPYLREDTDNKEE